MIAAGPDRVSRARGLALQVFAMLAIGSQFGIVEAWRLRQGNYEITTVGLLEFIAGHAAVALVLGAPLLSLVLLPKTVLSGVNSRRLLSIAPSLFTMFSMAAITANVRDPRAVLHPACIAWDVGILIAAVLIGWTWSRRPSGRGLYVALAACLFLVNGVLISLALRSVDPPSSADTLANAGGRTGDLPHIILVVVDTLRADHLGVYGYARPTSPNIDAIAAKGAVFNRAYAATNWTRPSMASFHTSTMPSRHGVIQVDIGLPSDLPLLAERLTDMGYRSAFFIHGVNVSPEIGYGRGVDHFDAPQSVPAVWRTPIFRGLVSRVFPAVRSWHVRGQVSVGPAERTEKALAWARTVDPKRPVFLYLHYMGPHDPYMPPKEFIAPFSSTPSQRHLARAPSQDAGFGARTADEVRQMIAQYDGEVLMHDFHVGHLLRELGALGWLDNAIVVITSDHGEAFGEHGYWGHGGYGLFEEVAQVPLIVWSSLPWNRPWRFDVPVSLIDIAPTLVDLAGGAIPQEWDGRSLRPWLAGERQDNVRVVFQEHPPAARGLRNADWAYFERDSGGELRQWLFSASDRAQENDLSSSNPALLQELSRLVQERGEFDSKRKVDAPTLELDEATVEKLKALGYVE